MEIIISILVTFHFTINLAMLLLLRLLGAPVSVKEHIHIVFFGWLIVLYHLMFD